MTINNYYRGGTDVVSGFLCDTEKGTFKVYCFSADAWRGPKKVERGYVVTEPKEGFSIPGDVSYFFGTLCDMNKKLAEYRSLGFKEDREMKADFGVFTI